MQQQQQQHEKLVSAFKSDYGTNNQKKQGNDSQAIRGGGSRRRGNFFKKKPFTNYNNEKSTEGAPATRGRGSIRGKFYPNRTWTLNNKKKNENMAKQKLLNDNNNNNNNTNNNNIVNNEITFKKPISENVVTPKNLKISENDYRVDVVNLNQNVPISNESRELRFNTKPMGNNYLEMKEKREQQRKQYIKEGLIDDPDKPRRLEDAITFVGTCEDKCPEFERYEREFQKNLDKFEIDSSLGTDGFWHVDHSKAVKAYHRSAAGNEQPLPCDVRPPHILKKTLDYLIDEIIMNHGIDSSHGFVRDRTRSIRQDFTLQNNRDEIAIEVHERIGRYHILCCHQLCQKEGFSMQQEKEQLFKVLQSLQEFYDDMRDRGKICPNEAEFRAYYIISHIW